MIAYVCISAFAIAASKQAAVRAADEGGVLDKH